MTEYHDQPTSVGDSTLEGISPGQGKVRLRFSQKDGSEGFIPNLFNFYYLPHSSCNLASLDRLNSHDIYHDNENETLYHVKTRKILAHAERWKNSYFLTLLNLSDSATQLCKSDHGDVYQSPKAYLHQTSEAKLTLTPGTRDYGISISPPLRSIFRALVSTLLITPKTASAIAVRGRRQPKATIVTNLKYVPGLLSSLCIQILLDQSGRSALEESIISSHLLMISRDLPRPTPEPKRATGFDA